MRPSYSSLALSLIGLLLIAGPVAAQDNLETSEIGETTIVAWIGNDVISRQELMVEALDALEVIEQRRAALANSNLDPAQEANVRALMAQQEFETISSVLDRMVREKMIAQEAARRGITSEELLEQEIESKIVRATEEQIKAYYEENKQYLSEPKTLEEMRPRITGRLEAESRESVRNAFLAALKKTTTFRIDLEAPRMFVTIKSDTPRRGPEDAPITIVEFGDFECPACRGAYPVIERLLREYEGQIQFAYRDYPLKMHYRAVPAAHAARCAAEQDRFWEYHQSLYTRFGNLSYDDLISRAKETNLDVALFTECLQSGRYNDAIGASYTEGRSLGIRSTPTLFINGRILSGGRYEFIKAIIDEELFRAGD